MQRQGGEAPAAYEYRRYWHNGYIRDGEWWHGGRLLRKAPRQTDAHAAVPVVTLDYCLAHRTRIYPDLGCQYCRERPRQAGRLRGSHREQTAVAR